MLSEEQMAMEIRRTWRARFLNLREVAEHYGTTVAFVSAVQTGRKPPTKRMMKEFGVEQVKTISYVKSQTPA